MSPSNAIILAAGLGKRMRPLTDKMPKPLVPVAGKPLIDHALAFVRGGGIRSIVINTSYMAEMLEAHIAATGGSDIRISREEAPLETGGGIREALPLLGSDPFVAVNSDVICLPGSRHPLLRLAEAWNDEAMDALLLLHPVDKAVGYGGPGDFFLSPCGRLRRRGDAATAPFVFTGVQLLHPRLFHDCPPADAFSMNLLWNRGMMPDGTLPRTHGLVHDGEWLEAGDPEGVRLAELRLHHPA